MMSTVELANATRIHPDLLLKLLDAGVFRHTVRLVRGRPMYEPEAVAVVGHATKLADEAAAGRITTVAAWLQLRRSPAA